MMSLGCDSLRSKEYGSSSLACDLRQGGGLPFDIVRSLDPRTDPGELMIRFKDSGFCF